MSGQEWKLGADAAIAIGRFNCEGVEGYRASFDTEGAPLRATREEAVEDERAYRRAKHACAHKEATR